MVAFSPTMVLYDRISGSGSDYRYRPIKQKHLICLHIIEPSTLYAGCRFERVADTVSSPGPTPQWFPPSSQRDALGASIALNVAGQRGGWRDRSTSKDRLHRRVHAYGGGLKLRTRPRVI